jgi:hypothetical protein
VRYGVVETHDESYENNCFDHIITSEELNPDTCRYDPNPTTLATTLLPSLTSICDMINIRIFQLHHTVRASVRWYIRAIYSAGAVRTL